MNILVEEDGNTVTTVTNFKGQSSKILNNNIFTFIMSHTCIYCIYCEVHYLLTHMGLMSQCTGIYELS